MQGWIKLHRKFTEWEWYDDLKTKHLINLKMNFPDEIFKNIMSFIHQTPYPKIELGKKYYLSSDYDLYNKQYYQLHHHFH